MVRMNSPSPPRSHVIAVLTATVAALFARAWLQIQLVEDGTPRLQAAGLSYVATLPVFLLLVLPMIRKDGPFIARQFRRTDFSLRLVVTAIVIGLLFRIAWWSQLVAKVSLGLVSNHGTGAIGGPSFAYQCPSLGIIALGILVSSILIPLIEEIVHRGYVQSFLGRRGPVVAIAVSTIIFMSFHQISGWGFTFVAGAILGTMYWLTGSLWAPVVTHAVINLTPQLTWRCMSLQWHPSPDSLPLAGPGIIAVAVFSISSAAIVWLLLTRCKRRDQ